MDTCSSAALMSTSKHGQRSRGVSGVGARRLLLRMLLATRHKSQLLRNRVEQRRRVAPQRLLMPLLPRHASPRRAPLRLRQHACIVRVHRPLPPRVDRRVPSFHVTGTMRWWAGEAGGRPQRLQPSPSATLKAAGKVGEEIHIRPQPDVWMVMGVQWG